MTTPPNEPATDDGADGPEDPDASPSGDPTTDAEPVHPAVDPTDPDGYSHAAPKREIAD